MKILLVNPNRFRDPPVIPLGLEYIAAAVELTGRHSVKTLDLCFSDNPRRDLEVELDSGGYSAAGFTVRNIDSVIIKDNRFFLDDIAALAAMAKAKGLAVIAGGASCDADPEGIRAYLGANYLVYGPGETALCELLDSLESGKEAPAVINGWRNGVQCALSRNPMKHFDYSRYIAGGGVAAFQTSAGCPWKCHFCIERCTPLSFRDHNAVVDDVADIIRAGYGDFHLADAEFNHSLGHAIAFLDVLSTRLRDESLAMRWSPYMRPKPVSGKLFDLLRSTGVSLITLSFESSEDERRRNGYSYNDLEVFLTSAREREIGVAIDMLSGAPGETIDEFSRAVEFFSRALPKRVNVNTAYRVYRNTALFEYLSENLDAEKEHMINSEGLRKNPLLPVFYQKLADADVKKITGDDSLFKIEGDEKGVNYQKVVIP